MKTVLITGASHGIAAATAETFAAAGYNLVLNYRSNKAGTEKIAARCRELGADVLMVQADMSEETDVARLRDEAVAKFGKLDVLINNASFYEEPDFAEATKADMLHAISQTFLTAALAVQAFVPEHITAGGCVLSVASVYGLPHAATPHLPLYSASKAAMISLTEGFAQRYAPDIRFNAVAPGYTQTPAWDGEPEERTSALLYSTLLKEWVQPEEIARTLLFMAETPHMTGETVVVDGGFMKRVCG